jgi:hypothetical protein
MDVPKRKAAASSIARWQAKNLPVRTENRKISYENEHEIQKEM